MKKSIPTHDFDTLQSKLLPCEEVKKNNTQKIHPHSFIKPKR